MPRRHEGTKHTKGVFSLVASWLRGGVTIRRTALAVLTVAMGTPASAQGLSESTGVNQYFTNCASCHEKAESHEAPRTALLKQMTPERIYETLSTGTMRNIAAALSDADKRLIAEWLGGRKIDSDLAGSALK